MHSLEEEQEIGNDLCPCRKKNDQKGKQKRLLLTKTVHRMQYTVKSYCEIYVRY